MKDELRLRIKLEDPPPGIDFGLQKGKGSTYETIQKQHSGSEDLNFEFEVGIKRGKDTLFDFSGPIVQGPAGNRFVYIDIGTYAGQKNTVWSRRLKVPLQGMPKEIADCLPPNQKKLLEIRIPGTGKDGGPNCGTVKPFPGWKAVNMTSN